MDAKTRAIEQVQRGAPFGKLSPRRWYELRPDELAPVVRIVHRRDGAIDTQDRIIFDHEFVLVMEGEADVTVDRRPIHMRAGSLLLIRPFVKHRIVSRDGRAFAHIAVHFDLAPNVPKAGRSPDRRTPYGVRLPQRFALPELVQLAGGDPVERALVELVRLWHGGDEVGRVAARGLTLAAPTWEVYVDDPAEVPEARLRTEVWSALG